MRLKCRTAENLLLSDDVLTILGITWPVLQTKVREWLEANPGHPRHHEMQLFAADWNRRDASMKQLRNTIFGITGYTRDWEICVGQAIARLGPHSPDGEGSLTDFLGPKVVDALNLRAI